MTEANDRRPFRLEDLKVASPCHEPWENMRGDDRRRFCERCELQVFNLSGMTRPEAERLVRGAAGRLCVRFHRRADGTVLGRDCPVGLAARTGRLLKACAAGLLALLGFLPGCRGTERGPVAPPPGAGPKEPCEGEIMGEIVAPAETEVLQGDVAIEEEILGRVLVVRPEMGKIELPPAGDR